MKTCSACKEVKDFFYFSKRSLSVDGYTASCKSCVSNRRKLYKSEKTYNKKRYWDALKHAKRKQRVPVWLNDEQLAEINNFYWLAQDLRTITGENYQVDHIIPLLGRNICGLHVPWNLQILPSDLNNKKNNKYEVSQ